MTLKKKLLTWYLLSSNIITYLSIFLFLTLIVLNRRRHTKYSDFFTISKHGKEISLNIYPISNVYPMSHITFYNYIFINF